MRSPQTGLFRRLRSIGDVVRCLVGAAHCAVDLLVQELDHGRGKLGWRQGLRERVHVVGDSFERRPGAGSAQQVGREEFDRILAALEGVRLFVQESGAIRQARRPPRAPSGKRGCESLWGNRVRRGYRARTDPTDRVLVPCLLRHRFPPFFRRQIAGFVGFLHDSGKSPFKTVKRWKTVRKSRASLRAG